MFKKIGLFSIASALLLGLAACGASDKATPAAGSSAQQSAGSAAEAPATQAAPAAANTSGAGAATKQVTYLGKAYTVPVKTDKIVIAGALEAMEDALVLGVKPTGAISVGGKFPAMFASITGQSASIGEKMQPNVESILKLKPDVILSTDKFPAETAEKLAKVGTTIPVSHISTDWEANLNLLAELTGKEEQAKQVLQKYKDDVKATKEQLAPVFKAKKVVAIRIRTGSINMYPADLFFNPSLYEDLGAAVPAEIRQLKSKAEVMSLEKFSELNPDYVFVQFSEDENVDTPKAFEDLQNNPIWQSIHAVKDGHVYFNIVDPLAQGGTAYSKMAFLDAVKKSNIMPKK